MVTEGELMMRSPGRLTSEFDPETGSSTMKGRRVDSRASKAGAGWVVLFGMAAGGMVLAGVEDEYEEGGVGVTTFAVGVGPKRGLGAGKGVGKWVEPTIADFSATAFAVISVREFVGGVGCGTVSRAVGSGFDVASEWLERGRESDSLGNASWKFGLSFGAFMLDGTDRLNAARLRESASRILFKRFGEPALEAEVVAAGGEVTLEPDSGAGLAGLETGWGFLGWASWTRDRCGRTAEAIDEGLGVLNSPKPLCVDAHAVPRHITASAAPQK
jgi:hypothetical protein